MEILEIFWYNLFRKSDLAEGLDYKMFGDLAYVDCYADWEKLTENLVNESKKIGNPRIFLYDAAVGFPLPQFLEELLMDYDYVKVFFYGEVYTLWRWKIIDENDEPFGYWPQLFEIKEIL